MTISTSNRRAGPYLGDGTQTAFPFNFKVFAAGDVRAFVANAQGSETELAAQDYRVTLHPDQETRPGGVLQLHNPLDTGNKLAIISAMPVTQPVVFTNQGGFYPTIINDSLDRLTICVQQLEETVSRCMVGTVNSGTKLPPLPAPLANNFLRWNADGTKIENHDIGVDTIRADINSLKTAVSGLSGGSAALDIARRLDALDARLQAVQTFANNIQTIATHAQTTANNAMPKSGGTFTGRVQLQYADTWAGITVDNRGDNARGAFYDGAIGGTIVASQQMHRTTAGGGAWTLQVAKPGNTGERENAFSADAERIWHKVYGDLHNYFAKTEDFYQAWFPNHYDGTEVFWNKKTLLKIINVMINTKRQHQWYSPNKPTLDLRLPSPMTGTTSIIGFAYDPNASTAIVPIVGYRENNTLCKISGFSVLGREIRANITLIGYSDQ